MKFLKYFLILFLLADLAYSFNQHYHSALDGDICNITVPAESYEPVLTDPFGIQAIFGGEKYAGPNRFFIHWPMRNYFLHMPILLQEFVDPVTSTYLSVAIFKTLVQLLLIYFISATVSNSKKISDFNFLIVASLITPMFQIGGYNGYMGIIDNSVTYTFFYAFPLLGLVIFLKPFYRKFHLKEELNFDHWNFTVWVLSIPVLALSGALIAPCFLIFSLLFVLNYWHRNFQQISSNNIIIRSLESIKRIPTFHLIFFSAVIFFSLYSVYLGSYNNENGTVSLSLIERYEKLGQGFYKIISRKLGPPLLIIFIIINLLLINRRNHLLGDRIIYLSKGIGLFTVIYLLLLPFGGYRTYREDILRYDTFMPITLLLIILFAATSLFLIQNSSIHFNKIFAGILVVVLGIYTGVDLPEFEHHYCEKETLLQIQNSKDDIVRLSGDCIIMNWDIHINPEASETNSSLLQLWNITEKKKLFYNAP